VFEEFRPVGVSATKQKGTGLQLTLCRKFVGLHGGRICVKSHAAPKLSRLRRSEQSAVHRFSIKLEPLSNDGGVT
jgi:signal transduction histidine kinase